MNKLSIFLLLFLSVAYSVQSSNTNYARTTDRIWLDSNEMHQGEYSWKMMKVSDVKASAEEVSSLGYNTSDWLSAIVPGTVLNSLVYNKKYPEPYYGLNNKIESNKIPDISKVGREFILIGSVRNLRFRLLSQEKIYGCSLMASTIGLKYG